MLGVLKVFANKSKKRPKPCFFNPNKYSPFILIYSRKGDYALLSNKSCVSFEKGRLK